MSYLRAFISGDRKNSILPTLGQCLGIVPLFPILFLTSSTGNSLKGYHKCATVKSEIGECYRLFWCEIENYYFESDCKNNMQLKQTDYNNSFRIFLYDVSDVVVREPRAFLGLKANLFNTGCYKISHFNKFPLLDLKHITQIIYHDNRDRWQIYMNVLAKVKCHDVNAERKRQKFPEYKNPWAFRVHDLGKWIAHETKIFRKLI